MVSHKCYGTVACQGNNLGLLIHIPTRLVLYSWALIFHLQFVEKAPEDVVRGVREKAAEAEEKLNLTKTRLSFLQSTITVPE